MNLRYKGTGPTLGQMLRGLRMGFAWLHEHGCFMRLSGDGPFLCEVYPCGLIPNSAKHSKPHVVFWDSKNPLDVEQIQRLKNIKRVKLPFSWWFDENGSDL